MDGWKREKRKEDKENGQQHEEPTVIRARLLRSLKTAREREKVKKHLQHFLRKTERGRGNELTWSAKQARRSMEKKTKEGSSN